jgi:hypothetical protein
MGEKTRFIDNHRYPRRPPRGLPGCGRGGRTHHHPDAVIEFENEQQRSGESAAMRTIAQKHTLSNMCSPTSSQCVEMEKCGLVGG